MESSLITQATNWVITNQAPALSPGLYCNTRDLFQARLDKMTKELLQKNIKVDKAYLVTALTGEIGNNSFDHNLGKWRDVSGIFFGYNFEGDQKMIILTDRGQGILQSLKRVKPSLKDDEEALRTAFTEKLSGRAPENRGNGLKFVKQTVHDQGLHITFYSGSAQAELNDGFDIMPSSQSIQGCLAIITF